MSGYRVSSPRFCRGDDWIDANHKPFDDLALAHWDNPELAYKEHEAVRLQMDFLRERGFVVTQKKGISTAFMADWGAGGPVIGILGEYDALGGLSQAVSAAKEVLAAEGKSGTVRYYGCPAEE